MDLVAQGVRKIKGTPKYSPKIFLPHTNFIRLMKKISSGALALCGTIFLVELSRSPTTHQYIEKTQPFQMWRLTYIRNEDTGFPFTLTICGSEL